MSINDDIARSLGQKLDSIEFTDGERQLLHDLIDAATGAEVSGFALPTFGDRFSGLIGDEIMRGSTAKPLLGDEVMRGYKAKPLTGNDNGSF